MTETPLPTAKLYYGFSIEHWLEIFSTVVLAVAAVAAAWSGYQAARWNGVQAAAYSQAGARRVEATRAATQAGQDEIKDLIDFNFYVEATVKQDRDLIKFYERRFRNEFAGAFDAWLKTNPINNPDAPASPFDMPQYQDPQQVHAQQLEQQAEDLFNQGSIASEQGDAYVLNSVILALALFFAGIAPRFTWLRVRAIVTLFSLLILLYCLFTLAANPIH